MQLNDNYCRLVLLLSVCFSFYVGQVRCGDLDPSVAMETYLKPSHNFAFSVFEKLISKDQKRNMLISIPALLNGLIMMYEGSDGLTKKVLEDNIHFPAKKADLRVAVNSVQNKLVSSVGPKNIYKKGTRFFAGQGITITDLYADILKEYYPNSGIENVNFELVDKAASYINAWVSSRSNGSIPTIVQKDDLSSDTQLVIASVEYFKGIWKTSFNPKLTRALPFHLSKTKTMHVPMMYAKGKYQVKQLHTEGITLLKIPYEDSSLSFLIVLPDENKDLEHMDQVLMTSLTAFKGDEDDLQECEVFVPKFTVEETVNLTPVFKEMGTLGTLFNSPANFSIMMEGQQVSISSALQKTRVQVDEVGSTAAAVQAYIISRRMMTYDDDCRVNVNRPFYFLITENDIPLPLFVGKILQPNPAS